RHAEWRHRAGELFVVRDHRRDIGPEVSPLPGPEQLEQRVVLPRDQHRHPLAARRQRQAEVHRERARHVEAERFLQVLERQVEPLRLELEPREVHRALVLGGVLVEVGDVRAVAKEEAGDGGDDPGAVRAPDEEDGAGSGHGGQSDAPPSMAMDCPVTCREASEAKNTAMPFRSSSPPRRPRGVCAITCSPITSSSPLDIFEGKNPGQRALTRMLYLPHSAASARVKCRTAALLVLYAIVVIPLPCARSPATDDMLMTLPCCRGIMQRRPTSWVRKNMALTFRFITLCHASGGWSSAGAPQVVPALFTRMSTVPYRSTALSTIAGMVSNFERSPAM